MPAVHVIREFAALHEEARLLAQGIVRSEGGFRSVARIYEAGETLDVPDAQGFDAERAKLVEGRISAARVKARELEDDLENLVLDVASLAPRRETLPA
jgi:hypothetical protein